MKRTYARITPQESTVFTGAAGTTTLAIPDAAAPEDTGADMAADAATMEACQVSATLAAAALSLTRLRPDAMQGLLRHP